MRSSPTISISACEATLFRADPHRAFLTYRRPNARPPAIGDRVSYIGSDGRLTELVVVARTIARPAFSHFPRTRLIVRIVEQCSICFGSGAVEAEGRCPECDGAGCLDCDDKGVIDFSPCPGCSRGRA